MGNIVVLDELTVNKIAAGEVVERPASVIKEMVENSIDAGATQISVEIRRGGITYIRISDNGCGIAPDDVLLAFEKHATSKITCGEDLNSIQTLGFRGEALSSISAVAKVEVTTRQKGATSGIKVAIHGGALVENTTCGCPEGTTFVVRELFFNTPARYKFLKKDVTEASHVIDCVERIALAHPEIAFRLINNGSEVLRTRGDGSLKNAIYSIYGKEVAMQSKEVFFEDKGVSIKGFVGGVSSATASRGRQSLFINGRYVKSKLINAAIDEAYSTLMMRGKYPFLILDIHLLPSYVDVNVHPTKMEVRFSEDGNVYRWVYNAIRSALFQKEAAPEQTVQAQQPETKQPAQTPQARPTFHIEHANITSRTDAPTASTTKVQTVKPQAQPSAQHTLQQTAKEQLYAKPFDFKSKMEVREERADYKQAVQSLPIEQVSDSKPQQPQTPQNPEKKVTAVPVEDFSTEHKILKHGRYIGQIFETFLILQDEEQMILLDQHAAHERVLYEKIKAEYEKAEVSAQQLLTPVVVELSISEYQAYEGCKAYFSQVGFGIEPFGENCIVIREIPTFVEISNAKEVVLELLQNSMEEGRTAGKITLDAESMHQKACKAAVKANHVLNPLEVRTLLDSMLELENPFTCPHGRPITIQMSKGELERKFKRVL